jgi:hypothetical protein
VVCVWGFGGDLHKAMTRFERTQPDRLSTSLAEALTHVQELVHPNPEAAPTNTDESAQFQLTNPKPSPILHG